MDKKEQMLAVDADLEDNCIDVQLSLSPLPVQGKNKSFNSPYQVAQFMDSSKPDTLSPDIFINFTNSFKRIMENQHEQSSQNGQSIDVMGNRIQEFNSPFDLEQDSPPLIIQDKENEHPASLITPLKIRPLQMRSPLQDITPSMTQKKKKTGSKFSISEKNRLLTPKTMQKSRLASSGIRALQRF